MNMQPLRFCCVAALAMTPWLGLCAVTRYVSLDGGDDAAGGYTNWAGAATAIQAAVDASGDDDVILVSNGIYSVDSGSQVVRISNSLTVRGVYGRNITVINGANARRCLVISQTNSVPVDISGFTITGGYIAGDGGAGIYVRPLGEVCIADCVISNNASTGSGAGVRKDTGAGKLILTNCCVIGNIADIGGGGVHASGDGMLELFDCQVLTNTAATSLGGGVFAQAPIRLEHCQVSSNWAGNAGGGLANWNVLTVVNLCIFEGNYAASGAGGVYVRHTAPASFISNCIIRGNTSPYTQDRVGAGIKFDGAGRLVNCLIVGNSATANYGGGLALGDKAAVCENLTIVSNSAAKSGGGLCVISGSAAAIHNSIIYDNTGTGAGRSNIYVIGAGLTFSNCCTAPLTAVVGDGNIDSPPLLVDPAAGQFQLQSQSPCVNTGLYQPWMDGALDLDGHARLDRFSRLVDMGCYEYVYRGSIFQLR